jgi:uncharacterized protein (DUF342 family)
MAKGAMTVTIDASNLKAVLRFSADPRGEEITKEKLLAVCSEAGIGSLLNARKIESLMSDLSRVKTGAQDITIAEGTPPRLAVDALVDFTAFDFTDEYTAEMGNKIFNAARIPIVYDVEQSNKRIEKVTTKKQALPFLKPQQEKTVSWEKVTKKNKITVDPKPDGCGYIRQNEVLAVFKPGQMGKEGVSILGKSIPTTRPVNVKLFISDNIKVTGNKVISEVAGFVRHGKNWIELLPYREHIIEVFKSKDNMTCLVNVIPGTFGAPEPNFEEVYAKAEELGIAKDTLIEPEAIGKMFGDAIRNGILLKDASISKPADSVVRLTISGDEVKATLSISKGSGTGKQVTIKGIFELLGKSNLLIKNQDKIKADISRFLESAEPELCDYVVCEGTSPGKGSDGSLSYLVSFVDDGECGTRIQSASKNITKAIPIPSLQVFPLDIVGKIAPVHKEQKIADIARPGTGADGVDVHGNKVPGIRGRDVRVTIYENLVTNTDSIFATEDGVLDAGAKDDGILLRIRREKIGKLDITVSPDKMKAFLTISQGDGGGKMIGRDDLIDAFTDMKIKKGIKDDVIENVFTHLGPGAEIKDQVIAEGNRSGAESRSPRLHIKMAGKRSAHNVKKSDLLAEIQPHSSKKSDEYDVFGNPPADDAEEGPESYIAGENVQKQVKKDGGIKFFAGSDGVLVIENHVLKIINMRTIEGDIDSSTGDLQVKGSVHVTGSIKSGIKLFVENDIVVDGNVGASLLSAGGSIKIRGSIEGGGKAIISAKKKIEARSAREAHILAVGDIRIENECTRCNVKCNGKLYLDIKKGIINGGKIKASKGIDVYKIGTAGVRTEISFGQDYLISDRIESIERKIKKLHTEIERIDAVSGPVKSGKAVSTSDLVRLRKDKFDHLKTIENLKKETLHLRDRFELHFPGSEIVVHGSLSQDTIVESHMRNLEVKKTIEKVIVTFNQTNGWIEQSFFI